MYVDENKAVELLNSHDIVALPTETVYGLAARFDSESALKKVFQVKRRPSFDPLIVHISHKNQLERLVTNVSSAENFLMDSFWPGPLTLVLPKKDAVSDIITSGLTSVAVRMPKNQSFHDIIQRTAPLAAPSANLFGHTSPTSAQHVESEFGGELAVFDGGPCTVGIESSVVQVLESENEIQLRILRPGMLSHEDMVRALADFSPKTVTVGFGATKASPGHVEDHYQPRVPLIVARSSIPWNSDLHKLVCDTLGLSETATGAPLSYENQDPTLVARLLYGDLRRLSDSTNGYIYLTVGDEFFSDGWRGIRDRIGKASRFSIGRDDSRFVVHHKLENFL